MSVIDDKENWFFKSRCPLFPGVDEATIIEILTKRNNAQRQQIKAAYLQEKGKPLDEVLKKALLGHLEEVVLALLKTPAQFDAEELRAAMKVNHLI